MPPWPRRRVPIAVASVPVSSSGSRTSPSTSRRARRCVVGESGSGKSVSSLSIMRLVEFGGGEIAEGDRLFDRRRAAARSTWPRPSRT